MPKCSKTEIKPLSWKTAEESKAGSANLEMLVSFIQNFQVSFYSG